MVMDDVKVERNPAIEDMHRRINDQIAVEMKRSRRVFGLIIILVFTGTVLLIKTGNVCT